MKKNSTISLIGILVLLLIVLAGCANPAPEQDNHIITNVTEAPMQAVSSPVISAAPAETNPAASRLTAEEAQEIALNHAGFTADQVTRLRCEFEIDDGVPEYEVEFRSGDTEYDYTIHAESGEIRHWDKDYDPVKTAPPPTAPPATTPPVAAPSATEAPASRLTAEEAQEIALNHAGFTADQVTRLRAEFDWDDGVPVYDVEFHEGYWEYDYEIHAETGKILSFDKDD